MKTAIIYASKHGTTEKVGGLIAEKLQTTDEVALFSLKKNSKIDINAFETVILGAPVYAGRISRKMKTFCKVNETVLLQKNIGLFVCGMELSKEKQKKELNDAFSDVLLKQSKTTGFLGGAFLFDKMNFFERMIIKKIAKTTTSVQRIDNKAVNDFIIHLKT